MEDRHSLEEAVDIAGTAGNIVDLRVLVVILRRLTAIMPNRSLLV